MPVFDLDPRTLLETARRLRDSGELPSGRKVGGRADFFLGGADNPIDPPPGWQPTGLQAKIDAGAQFVQTQFCMDAGVVRRYMARLAEHGLTERMSMLIGIAPLRSAKSARWIKEKLFGAIIPDAVVAPWKARSIRWPKGAASASISCTNWPTCRTSPAFTSWRRATTRRCRRSSPPRAKALSASRRYNFAGPFPVKPPSPASN
jgi:hypothetical protein